MANDCSPPDLRLIRSYLHALSGVLAEHNSRTPAADGLTRPLAAWCHHLMPWRDLRFSEATLTSLTALQERAGRECAVWPQYFSALLPAGQTLQEIGGEVLTQSGAGSLFRDFLSSVARLGTLYPIDQAPPSEFTGHAAAHLRSFLLPAVSVSAVEREAGMMELAFQLSMETFEEETRKRGAGHCEQVVDLTAMEDAEAKWQPHTTLTVTWECHFDAPFRQDPGSCSSKHARLQSPDSDDSDFMLPSTAELPDLFAAGPSLMGGVDLRSKILANPLSAGEADSPHCDPDDFAVTNKMPSPDSSVTPPSADVSKSTQDLSPPTKVSRLDAGPAAWFQHLSEALTEVEGRHKTPLAAVERPETRPSGPASPDKEESGQDLSDDFSCQFNEMAYRVADIPQEVLVAMTEIFLEHAKFALHAPKDAFLLRNNAALSNLFHLVCSQRQDTRLGRFLDSLLTGIVESVCQFPTDCDLDITRYFVSETVKYFPKLGLKTMFRVRQILLSHLCEESKVDGIANLIELIPDLFGSQSKKLAIHVGEEVARLLLAFYRKRYIYISPIARRVSTSATLGREDYNSFQAVLIRRSVRRVLAYLSVEYSDEGMIGSIFTQLQFLWINHRHLKCVPLSCEIGEIMDHILDFRRIPKFTETRLRKVMVQLEMFGLQTEQSLNFYKGSRILCCNNLKRAVLFRMYTHMSSDL